MDYNRCPSNVSDSTSVDALAEVVLAAISCSLVFFGLPPLLRFYDLLLRFFVSLPQFSSFPLLPAFFRHQSFFFLPLFFSFPLAYAVDLVASASPLGVGSFPLLNAPSPLPAFASPLAPEMVDKMHVLLLAETIELTRMVELVELVEMDELGEMVELIGMIELGEMVELTGLIE